MEFYRTIKPDLLLNVPEAVLFRISFGQKDLQQIIEKTPAQYRGFYAVTIVYQQAALFGFL